MIKLSKIKANPNNPRIIKDEGYQLMTKSIKEFPDMMKARPIVVDGDYIIMGGNQRFKVLIDLGYKEVPDEWVKRISDYTAEQWQEFIIKDNLSFGQWNWEDLTKKWDHESLVSWGIDAFRFQKPENIQIENKNDGSIQSQVAEGDSGDASGDASGDEVKEYKSNSSISDSGFVRFEVILRSEDKDYINNQLKKVKEKFNIETVGEALTKIISLAKI